MCTGITHRDPLGVLGADALRFRLALICGSIDGGRGGVSATREGGPSARARARPGGNANPDAWRYSIFVGPRQRHRVRDASRREKTDATARIWTARSSGGRSCGRRERIRRSGPARASRPAASKARPRKNTLHLRDSGGTYPKGPRDLGRAPSGCSCLKVERADILVVKSLWRRARRASRVGRASVCRARSKECSRLGANEPACFRGRLDFPAKIARIGSRSRSPNGHLDHVVSIKRWAKKTLPGVLAQI